MSTGPGAAPTPATRGRRRVLRFVLVLALAGLVAAAGLRVLVHASTFQLFGDYLARVETTDKVVALTFDDGPHPTHTPAVLDLLDEHRVKATFFMMGRNIERYPAVARDVVRRGHDVGNHSYSHPKLILMSPRRVQDEIERADALIRGIGVTGPIPFRAPHAAKFIVLPYVLMKTGRLSVLADADPEEWRRRPAAVMTASIMEQTRPGSIIALHDPMGRETIATLGNVLATLSAQGYRFERISEFVRRRLR